MITESTSPENLKQNLEKAIETLEKFNKHIKDLEDNNLAGLEGIKNNQNDPQVIQAKDEVLKSYNDVFYFTKELLQSKNRELVEFTKLHFRQIYDIIEQSDKYLQLYFISHISELDPVRESFLNNFTEIFNIPQENLVSGDSSTESSPTDSAQSAGAGVAGAGSAGAVTIPPGPPGSPGSSGSSGGQPPQGGSREQTAEEVFNKYMVGPFDPNSSMDRGKMEVVKNMLRAYESKYGTPFNISSSEDITKMEPIANAAYKSASYKKITSSRGSANVVEPALYKTRKDSILGIGGEDVYSPEPPPIGTRKYEVIDPKTGKVTQVRRATPVNTINIPKPGSVRVEDDGTVRRKSKFGGALGSLSNFFGDVGNTLKKNK